MCCYYAAREDRGKLRRFYKLGILPGDHVETTLGWLISGDEDLVSAQSGNVRNGLQVIIKPTRGWSSLGLHDVWEHRDLLYFLFWREIKGNYRQMAFGPLWIIIVPLINMLIFSLIFGKLARLPSEGIPYPLFTYVAILPWQFFANATRKSSESLVYQKEVISKVYFPRLVIPLAGVLSALVDFVASFVVLIPMLIVYKVMPTWRILTLPLFLMLATCAGLGVGLWLAGLAVKYHDVKLGIGFALTVWQYLTPVAYSATLIPESWQLFYRLNPMTTVVEGFRWSLLNRGGSHMWTSGITVLLVVVVLISGAFYFRRTERTIVDMI